MNEQKYKSLKENMDLKYRCIIFYTLRIYNKTDLLTSRLPIFDNRIERGVSFHLTSILYPQNTNLSRKHKKKYGKWSLYPVLYIAPNTFLNTMSGQVLFISTTHVIYDY